METLQLSVLKIETTANEAILVTLRDKGGQKVYYQAGQFLTFIIDFHGRELRRSYSISGTPGIDEHITVLIKRVENGAISRYLVDHLKTGDIITSLYPGGRFTLDTESSNRRTVFFLAAGSGISPIYSLLKKLLMGEPLSRAILIYQNHDETTIIFKDELEILQQKFGERLIVLHLLSNPHSRDHHPQRLNNFLLEKLVNDYLKLDSPHDFYCCGPSAFMRMIRFVLKLMGVGDGHIRKEHFVIEAVPPPPVMLDTSLKEIKILWKEKLFEFSVAYPETILQAALKHDIHLPFSCRAGRCASCAITCISGKVKMSVNEVLTSRDLEGGLVLSCVGYAETDLVLKLS